VKNQTLTRRALSLLGGFPEQSAAQISQVALAHQVLKTAGKPAAWWHREGVSGGCRAMVTAAARRAPRCFPGVNINAICLARKTPHSAAAYGNGSSGMAIQDLLTLGAGRHGSQPVCAFLQCILPAGTAHHGLRGTHTAVHAPLF